MIWADIENTSAIQELKIENYVDFICRAVPTAVYKMAEELSERCSMTEEF